MTHWRKLLERTRLPFTFHAYIEGQPLFRRGICLFIGKIVLKDLAVEFWSVLRSIFSVCFSVVICIQRKGKKFRANSNFGRHRKEVSGETVIFITEQHSLARVSLTVKDIT